jgi:YD repeat-containing protein
MADASGTTTWNYEPLTGRLQSKVTPQGPLSYTYDVAGNLRTSGRVAHTIATTILDGCPT